MESVKPKCNYCKTNESDYFKINELSSYPRYGIKGTYTSFCSPECRDKFIEEDHLKICPCCDNYCYPSDMYENGYCHNCD